MLGWLASRPLSVSTCPPSSACMNATSSPLAPLAPDCSLPMACGGARHQRHAGAKRWSGRGGIAAWAGSRVVELQTTPRRAGPRPSPRRELLLLAMPAVGARGQLTAGKLGLVLFSGPKIGRARAVLKLNVQLPS